MVERVAIRQRFPRNELLSSDDVCDDTQLWANKATRKYRPLTAPKCGGKFDAGGSMSPDSSDSPGSDRDPGGTLHVNKPGSDSDSDFQTWTKNPLMVRRVKRSNKSYNTDKRWSGAGMGVATGNKDLVFYHSSEGGASETLSLGRNTNSNASGSSSKGSSKYQRLEEMRRKRINLSITSDEEGNAQTTKTPLRYGSHIRNFPGPISRIEPSLQTDGFKSQFGPGSAHKNNQQTRLETEPSILPTRGLQAASPISNYSARIQPTIVPTASPLPLARVGFSPLLLTSEYSGKSAPHNQANQQGLSGYSHPQSTEPRESFYIQLEGSRQQNMTGSRQPDMTGSKQPFYKIVDMKPPSPTYALNNTPPQFTIHKFTTQLPTHSTNSAVDSRLKPNGGGLQNSHYVKPNVSPPSVQAFQPASLHAHSQQHNTGLNMPVKTVKQDIPKPHMSQTGLVSLRRVCQSDDSLDELVESNIRYLDRTNDKATPKRNPSTQVMRVVNQADPRSAGLAGFSSRQHNQPSVQVRTSTNIELRVSVPTGAYPSTPGTAVHRLQIEPASGRRGLDDQGISPPDVVPRQMGSWRSMRTNNESYDKVGLTQSDNSDQFADTRGHQSERGLTRGSIGDGKTRSDTEVSRPANKLEKGMFSDVEYDIEVSERVKKWETLLKDRDNKLSKSKDCDTIHENMDDEPTVLPSESEPQKAALPWQQFQVSSPYFNEVVRASTAAPRKLTSEMSPVETHVRRHFQVMPDPAFNAQPRTVSKVFHTSPSLRSATLGKGNDQPQQNLFAKWTQSIPVTNTCAEPAEQFPMSRRSDLLTQKQTDTSSHATKLSRNEGQQTQSHRPSKLTHVRDLTKRGSVYKEELDEISGLKADTVINLRRHFDTGSTTVTSEDDQRSVSTASAKLSRPWNDLGKGNEPVDWLIGLPGYKAMIKDADLWSPNLESTQGVPVSIERVTARTLQTIPFSEDPFWKEMEEMTSFDPSGSVGQPGVGMYQERAQTVNPVRSHHRLELIPPLSLTLPSQSRDQVIPIADRIQKSKPLYTPNITPLSVEVSRNMKSDAVVALDEVLDDINSSSQDRIKQSSGDKPLEAENVRTVSAFPRVSRDLPNHPRTVQPKLTFKNGNAALGTTGTDSQLYSSKPTISAPLNYAGSDGRIPKPTYTCHHQPQQPSLQPQQPSHQPQQPSLQGQIGKSQTSHGILSGYQLDVNLLKQKLLKTGLVEADTEDPADREQYRRSWPRSSVHPGNSITSVTTTQSYIKPAAQSNSFPSRAPILSPAISSTQPGTTDVDTARVYSVKQAGLHTLDTLQNALSPFRSTSYQPGPESLYGPSKLEFFKEPTLSTSGEICPPTQGWAYHNQGNVDGETTDNKECALPHSSSRLQEVNQSMDDLKNLALDVGQRITVIKSKLQSANENSLDSILSSLRALAPEVKRHENEPATFEDYYATKRSKLSDALTELDRIYGSLELNVHDMSFPDKAGHKTYDQHKSNHPIASFQPKSNHPIASFQPKSVHLRPMQTRISSVFIRGPESANKTNTEKEKESQIDVISKSFEAIVDEVNKTTNLLSQVAERNRQENMAPETHKQTFRMTVKPGSKKGTNVLPCPTADVTLTPSVAAAPTQAAESVDKVRPNLEENVKDDIADDKLIPELVSDRASGTDFTPLIAQHHVTGIDHVPQKSSTVKVTASSGTKQTTPPSEIAQQSRNKHVHDNKIIQEDRATKQSSEKTFWVSPLTQLSPTLTRKVMMRPESGVKLQQSQVLSETQTEEPSSVKPLYEAALEHVPITLLVTEGLTAPGVRGVSGNSESLHSASPGQTTDDLVKNTNTTSLPASSTPVEQKSLPTDPKLDEGENPLNDDPRTKRRVGTGVAMMMDKFSSGKVKVDPLKFALLPRDAPDMNESITEATVTKDSALIQPQPTATVGSATSLRNREQPSSTCATFSPCKKSAVSFLVRKVGEPETKAATSQPSSPISKSTGIPCNTQLVNPDTQSINDDTPAESPRLVEKEPRTGSSGESSPSDRYLTPKEAGSPPEVAKKMHLPDKSIQKKPLSNRPHSFHELISCSEAACKTPAKHNFRKCASSSELNSGTRKTDVAGLSD